MPMDTNKDKSRKCLPISIEILNKTVNKKYTYFTFKNFSPTRPKAMKLINALFNVLKCMINIIYSLE